MSAVQPPSIPYNPSVPDFDLKSLLNLHKKDIMKTLNCHAIATVETFTPSSANSPARVTATINYQKTNFVVSQGVYVAALAAYPTLVDCPAIILGGGSTRMTFPIAQGDECLILFNDRDLSTWYQGSIGQGVPTARMHSLADGVALVGLYNTNRAFAIYDSVRALITDGNVSVGINPSTHKATIKNQTQGTLGTILNNILTQLQTLANTVPPSGTPLNPAVATQLGTLATDLQGLLE